MSKFIKYIACVLMLVLGGLALSQTVNHEHKHQMHLLKNAWLTSTNPAGLAISEYSVYGISDLGYQHKAGNYHRAQQGSAHGGLLFNSQRYNKIADDWYTWGQFEFSMNREKDRRFSNNFNTYNV